MEDCPRGLCLNYLLICERQFATRFQGPVGNFPASLNSQQRQQWAVAGTAFAGARQKKAGHSRRRRKKSALRHAPRAGQGIRRRELSECQRTSCLPLTRIRAASSAEK